MESVNVNPISTTLIMFVANVLLEVYTLKMIRPVFADINPNINKENVSLNVMKENIIMRCLVDVFLIVINLPKFGKINSAFVHRALLEIFRTTFAILNVDHFNTG